VEAKLEEIAATGGSGLSADLTQLLVR